MPPLAGLKVVELAHIMAGPICGLMLADLGADVIKVEKVPGGDDARRFTPPAIDGESAAFLIVNRHKRGVAVDLKREAGREVLGRLLAGADVVIENFRRGTMERLGLGYEQLCERNPRLIACEVSGFGRTGPYADRSGFDLVAQGMSGLMSLTGEGPGRPPVKVGVPVTDITAGLLATMGVLAALVERTKTGKGQRVDTSLFEAGITHTYWQSAMSLATGVSPGPLGTAHPLSAPYQAFRTKDGWLTVGAANQANWLRLLAVLDASALAEDPRFHDNASRLAHVSALAEALSPRFSSRTTAEWLVRLEAAGVPAGPVLDVLGMHADPQTRAREMIVEVSHSRLGVVKALGFPVKLSASPAETGARGAPVYGEHTREVLAELGYDETDVARLVADGAVVCADMGTGVRSCLSTFPEKG
ncbi:MAG: CoA transferase [Vicinamibacterales bacterium]